MNQEQKLSSKNEARGNRRAKIKPARIAKQKSNEPKIGEKRKLAFIWGSWRDYRATPEFLKSFADQLVQWITEQDEVFSVESFLISKGLPERTYYEWLDYSVDIQQANDFANMVIAERRERGAITRKLDSHSSFRMMAAYSRRYRQVKCWEKSLETSPTTSTELPLDIPDFGPCPLVPERKDLVHDENNM